MSEQESEGTRLGRMVAAEPELTRPEVTVADREFSRRFIAYLMADGFSGRSALTRMERLKFETIVRGKSYGEVLAGIEEL